MKRTIKQIAIVACIILFATPVLSACRSTRLYTVFFRVGTGGIATFKIGETNVVHGSSYKENTTITITVTTEVARTVRSVQANSTDLTATSESSEGGVTTAIFKHKLKGNVEFNIAFGSSNEPLPPPGPCTGCDRCDPCMTAARGPAVSAFQGLIARGAIQGIDDIVIVTQAFTDIALATRTTQIRQIFANAMRDILTSKVSNDCDCSDSNCVTCKLAETKTQMVTELASTMPNFIGNIDFLVEIIEIVGDICEADSQETAATIFLDILTKVKGLNVIVDLLNNTLTVIFLVLDPDAFYFPNPVASPIAILEIASVVALDFAEVALRMRRNSPVTIYLTSEEYDEGWQAYLTAVVEGIVASEIIIAGRRTQFMSLFLSIRHIFLT